MPNHEAKQGVGSPLVEEGNGKCKISNAKGKMRIVVGSRALWAECLQHSTSQETYLLYL